MIFKARLRLQGPPHPHTGNEAPWWLYHWDKRTEAPMAQYELLVVSFQGWYYGTRWAE